MKDRLGQFASLILGTALVGGCASDAGGPTILDASDHPYVSDLPLPVAFKLVERQSEEKAAAGTREVKHVYHGKGSLQAVKNFYQSHMPQANWQLIDHSLNKGVYIQRYQKARERCEIRIERMPAGLFGATTQIRATIHPNTARALSTTSD